FLGKVASILGSTAPKELEDNRLYRNIQEFIPGHSTAEKLNLIQRTFQSTSGWMQDLIAKSNLTQEKLVQSLSTFVDMADRKLDYAAAFLDMTTNYFEHTG